MSTTATTPRGRKRPTMQPSQWRPIFLERLAEHGNATLAAQQAGVSPRKARYDRDSDPEFAAQWEEALNQIADALEEVLFTKARDLENKNTAELIFALKGLRPARWRESVIRIEQVHSEVDTIASKYGISSKELLEEVAKVATGKARDATPPQIEQPH